MRAAMTEHLDQTLAEAAHELNGQYAASVATYDEIHHHILEMADLLSAGIIARFPQRFAVRLPANGPGVLTGANLSPRASPGA